MAIRRVSSRRPDLCVYQGWLTFGYGGVFGNVRSLRILSAAIRNVCLWPMLSKKDFWSRSKEDRFKSRRVSRKLIQVSLISDSNIAHFWVSTAHWLTFSTASVICVISGND
jgi:hypothetical protein